MVLNVAVLVLNVAVLVLNVAVFGPVVTVFRQNGCGHPLCWQGKWCTGGVTGSVVVPVGVPVVYPDRQW